MAGIKVTLRAPEDSTKIINAEFATVRSFPAMGEALNRIAKASVTETIAGRRVDVAYAALQEATTAEAINVAADALQAAQEAQDATGVEIFEALRAFVELGYELAGAPPAVVERLTMATDITDLAQLKAKCLYGAGVVDFTKRGDQ